MSIYSYSPKQKVAEYKDYFAIPAKYKISPYFRIVRKHDILKGNYYCVYDDRR